MTNNQETCPQAGPGGGAPQGPQTRPITPPQGPQTRPLPPQGPQTRPPKRAAAKREGARPAELNGATILYFPTLMGRDQSAMPPRGPQAVRGIDGAREGA